MKKKRILFVDDEPMILNGLKRMLRDKRGECDMEFVAGGKEALEYLSNQAADMIVSDMRMPDMDGAALLNEVRKLYPHMIRIILSGHASKEVVMKLVLPAHQYLSKPCEPEILKSTIQREFVLQTLVPNDSIRRVVSKIDRLPSMPSLYGDIVAALKRTDTSVLTIANIIGSDASMTAKVLQLVNSAFFALPSRVSNLVHAVSLLGLDTIKTLVLSVHIFSQFDRERLNDFDIMRVWKHSVQTGIFARTIGKIENQEKTLVDEFLMAGVLHDLGKLILADNFPEQYGEIREMARQEKIPLQMAEGRVLDTATHAEIGAYLIGLWGLPGSIVEAVGSHHRSELVDFSVLSASSVTFVANSLEHETGGGEGEPAIVFRESAVPIEKLNHWRQECRKMKGDEVYDE
jgi:HD-like signal output (HDOD) protein